MSERFDNLKKSGYATVSGLKMYYEIHGTARGLNPPLVLVHGGGSTIETSFGKILQPIAETRQVIAIERQRYESTADINHPFSFEQSADDAATLLRYLEIELADFFGYSKGGSFILQTALYIPLRASFRKSLSPRGSS